MAAVAPLRNAPTPRAARRPLRLLLSAYACEPNRGSEPGIGWQWATRLAAYGHEIHVLTRANNREAIEASPELAKLPTLHFAYYDLPTWARTWKRGGRGVQLYYWLWQLGSFRVAKRLHRQHRFDVVHHLTFGVYRQPSLLAFLDAPFVFGPIGGGEWAPRSFYRGLPFSARLREFGRDLANWVASIDPLLRTVFRKSKVILCKTEETRARIPKVSRTRAELFLEIGTEARPTRRTRHDPGQFRVLYVGRFVPLKGLHLALPAFAGLVRDFPRATLTLIGSGSQEKSLRRMARDLGIEANVDWRGWLARDEALHEYARHDVFLFPSLHDSSGNAVLEAMTSGLPVVCLKRGGPAAIVDAFSGIAVDTDDPSHAIQQLTDALLLLARNSRLHAYLSHGAHTRATNSFLWRHQIERMNSLYYRLRPDARETLPL